MFKNHGVTDGFCLLEVILAGLLVSVTALALSQGLETCRRQANTLFWQISALFAVDSMADYLRVYGVGEAEFCRHQQIDNSHELKSYQERWQKYLAHVLPDGQGRITMRSRSLQITVQWRAPFRGKKQKRALHRFLECRGEFEGHLNHATKRASDKRFQSA